LNSEELFWRMQLRGKKEDREEIFLGFMNGIYTDQLRKRSHYSSAMCIL
jgi:hypothetical protein